MAGTLQCVHGNLPYVDMKREPVNAFYDFASS